MTETTEKVLQDVVTKAWEKAEMEGKTQVKEKTKELRDCDNCGKSIKAKDKYFSLTINFCSMGCLKGYLIKKDYSLVDKEKILKHLRKDLDAVKEY